MPKRARVPSSGLDYPGKRDIRQSTRPGGRDTTAVGEHFQRKTYVLERDQVTRLKEMAASYHVGINELARWLLTQAMDRVDDGEWELPLESEQVWHLRG